MIIGGGATGVELAGEIRDETSYDDKSVSLIHSGPALLNYDFGEKIQVNAKAQLEDKNVKLFLGKFMFGIYVVTTLTITRRHNSCCLNVLPCLVCLGERVSNLEYLTTSETVGGQTVKMESGKSIPADLIFVCIGLKANSELTNGVFGRI